MKNLRPYFKLFPEIYFLLSVLFYWFSAAVVFNPVAIALFFVFILQLIYKNKVAGIIIAVLFIVVNFFMVLALLSEFHEFQIINSGAKTLLLVGMLYFGLNIAMSVIMGVKYLRQTPKNGMVSA